MPSSKATRKERLKRKRAQETPQEKEQRRCKRRQKYKARDLETIERQRKRRNERDRQTHAAMDKDEKELREIQKCERTDLKCWDKHHPRPKQRITNLMLTNNQFKSEFIKKMDSNPHYNTNWMKEVLSIESDLYMHMQQLHETEYHYLNVVPDSRVESAHREILSLAIDLDCMIITQLKKISVHRNLIDSIIYTMCSFER